MDRKSRRNILIALNEILMYLKPEVAYWFIADIC